MTHRRGKRGKQSEIEWEALQSEVGSTFWDTRKAELIAIKPIDYVVTIMEEKFPYRTFDLLACAEKGEVLVDNHGRGTWQILP
jgi:hypothetical protein